MMDFRTYLRTNIGRTKTASLYEETKNYARALAGQSKINEQQVKDYEDFLNDIFYPSKDSKSMTFNRLALSKSIADQRQNLVRDLMEKALNKIDPEGASAETIDIATCFQEMNKIGQKSHNIGRHNRGSVQLSTLKGRLDQVKTLLQAKEGLKGLPQYQKLVVALKNCELALNSVIKAANEQLGIDVLAADTNLSSFFTFKDKHIAKKVANMDNFYQEIFKYRFNLTKTEYAKIFESILTMLPSNIASAIAEEGANSLVDQFIEGTAGSEYVSEGINFSNNLLYLEKIKTTLDKKGVTTTKKITNKKTGSYTYIADFGNETLKFDVQAGFNPTSKRQGKMDVLWTLNEEGSKQTPFRISAKEWNAASSGDFGTTSLLYALFRSLGETNTIGYIYDMQNPVDGEGTLSKVLHLPGSDKGKWHEIAKLAIVVDILQGLSQSQNSADIIVLNLRAERRIKVYSVLDILDKVTQNMERLNIQGYNGSAIQQHITAIRKTLLARGGDNSGAYKQLVQSYLHSIQVVLTYSNLLKLGD